MSSERIEPQPDDFEHNSHFNPDNFFQAFSDRTVALGFVNRVLLKDEIADVDLFKIIASTATIFYSEIELVPMPHDQLVIVSDFNEQRRISLENSNFHEDFTDSNDDGFEIATPQMQNRDNWVQVELPRKIYGSSSERSSFDRVIGLRQQSVNENQEREEIAFITLEEETNGNFRKTRTLELERYADGEVESNEYIYIEALINSEEPEEIHQIISRHHISNQGKRELAELLRDYLQKTPVLEACN